MDLPLGVARDGARAYPHAGSNVNAPVYLALKFVAYCAWCGYGVRRFQPHLHPGAATVRALWLGAARLALGIALGLVIWLASTMVYAALSQVLDLDADFAAQLAAYLLVYVPVRVFEWGVIAKVAFGRFIARWVAGGVALSIAADVPMIAALDWNVPLGRFFC